MEKRKLDDCVALIGFYQDRDAGERLLKNLTELGIPSMWADSRVEGFKQYNNSDTSTDGFPGVIFETPNAHLFSLGLTKPGEGMTFLLKKASDAGYKYVITLGCDEYLEGDIELFLRNLQKIPMKEPTKLKMPITEHNSKCGSHGGNVAERVVFMPQFVFLKDVHYVYFHNYFGYDKPMKDTPLVLGMTIHHDDTIRDDSRNKAMDEYQQSQKKREFDSILQMIKDDKI